MNNCTHCNKIYTTSSILQRHLKGPNKCSNQQKFNVLQQENESLQKEIESLKQENDVLKRNQVVNTTINHNHIDNSTKSINITCQSIPEYLKTTPSITYHNEPHIDDKIAKTIKQMTFNGYPFNLYQVLLNVYKFEKLNKSLVIKDAKRKIIVIEFNNLVKELDENQAFQELCRNIYQHYITTTSDKKMSMAFIDDFFHEYNQLKRDIIRNHDDIRWAVIKNQQILPSI
jgi:predicted  nucleic acid-binding Zn-ribbon protein